MFSTSILDLPTHVDSAELGYGKSLAFDTSSISVLGFLKHSLGIIIGNQDSKQIFYFLLLNLSYMFVQLAYGVWTNSLGLISDAIHMFFDCLALGVGLFASVLSKWPSNQKFSYGYSRIETVAAFFNSVFLVLISISIVMEAIQRLVHPPEMSTHRLLLVSFVGLIVNLVGIFAFNHGHDHGHGHSHGHSHGHGHHHHGHDHGHVHNANMQGVFLHIMADTLGSAGVIVSTLLIQWFGWTGFDPIASLFIAVLIIMSVLPLIRQSASVLMLELSDETVNQVEGTLEEVKQLEGVTGIDTYRFWPNEAETVVGSIHVFIQEGVKAQEVRRTISELFLNHVQGLKEICVQVESVNSSRLLKQQQQQQQQQQHYNNSMEYNIHNHYTNTPQHSANEHVSFRSTLLPQPTFATTEYSSNHSSPALLSKALKKKD
ncbi:MAG: cation efflux family-domain-containing protein [Benjaminiella poitrasii]|nr:MAG: cation efflux family-domain-containing protein [Benjaminiella poitrasii]